MNELESIYQRLLEPSQALVEDLKKLKGDILILGAGGKMGPDLCRLARKASDLAGTQRRIIAVSRFSEAGLAASLEKEGIETISADLLVEDQLQALPLVPNVIYLAGTKFGTKDNASFTWAMNAYLPGRVAEKYKASRIVVFSSGNIYPFTPVHSGGATEETQPAPIGEYAQSCLGRERMFQYFSNRYKTPQLIYRLNYANDVSYGVLLELAKTVYQDKPVDLRMGNVNVIWQGDANEIAIRSLHHCSVPARLLNVTGPETISVRWIAQQFAKKFDKEPAFINEEQPTALLNNAAQSFRLFGYPRTGLTQMIDLIAEWVHTGGKTIGKATHFQEREGQF